jgi:hypothetical protein
VFVVVLVAVIVIVNSAFTVIINRSVAAVLNEQTQLASELAAHNTPPAELVARLETRSVHVRLALTDGRQLGNLEQRPRADRTLRTRRVRLSTPSAPLNGSELTLALDGDVSRPGRRRRRLV